MEVKIAENLVEELRWRGLLKDVTEGAEEALAKQKVTGYIGFDPTADSLHVGSLLPIMVLVHLQRHGHSPIALAGGGTGMIGDPSGKSKERQLLSEEQLQINIKGIKAQLAHFLDFEKPGNPARLVNNADWLRPMNLLDFLRDTGKHFTVNYMMAKDSVRTRLESEEGISFTEFSYMLLQSYDFLQLYERYGCTLQMGGSDQWGNITAGIMLIRKVADAQAHGAVVPLVTTSAGTKFGKTEAGTVWLDSKRTSPYRFYQFWLNTTDDDAIRYLKYFTLLSREEIAAYEHAVETEPHLRAAQTRLAEEVTRAVHGEDGLARAQAATDVLFGNRELDGMSADDLVDIFAEVPSCAVPRADLEGDGLSVVDLGVMCGLDRSKKQVRNLIESGGLYMNNHRVDDMNQSVTLADAIDGRVIVLRKGRKQYSLVRMEEA
ncbi:tyrosine--tRNA ligase [Aggregatilinea lenta]|uniref:tyrosine--tRNA ligase n=1 Tax=Aggregatilinea lenta TaxID=913108 RepID=UPI000E5A8186|nr:tyrosine--tRNA ligase [Aggregatilinea lenta]